MCKNDEGNMINIFDVLISVDRYSYDMLGVWRKTKTLPYQFSFSFIVLWPVVESLAGVSPGLECIPLL